MLKACYSRRALNNNQLTGSIPTTIWQLTELAALYVGCRVNRFNAAHDRLVLFLRVAQGLEYQSIHWIDFVEYWTIDRAETLVSRTRLTCEFVDCPLVAQVLADQQFDQHDPFHDWSVVDAHGIVRCHHVGGLCRFGF